MGFFCLFFPLWLDSRKETAWHWLLVSQSFSLLVPSQTKRGTSSSRLWHSDGLRLNIGWAKYRCGWWSLSLAEEKGCCKSSHELHFLSELVGRRQSIEPSDGTQIAGPCLTSEDGSAPLSSPAPSLMPDAYPPLSCLKLLQKILPFPQITT